MRHGKRRVLAVSPGVILRELSPGEVADLVHRWLIGFGRGGAGIDADAFMWHVFSGGHFPSVGGQAALAAYTQQTAHEYVVLSNSRDQAFLTDERPERCSLSDWFVSPPNLAWTMAFTHEDGWLGPYFARHPDHVRLDAENHALMRKARDAATARRNGWA